MKAAFFTAVAALAAGAAAGSMAELRKLKLLAWAEQREAGAFDADQYASSAAVTSCVSGKAGEYGCSNVNMHGFLSHQAMGSSTREGNDIWGWTSSTGREFGIVGQTDGVAFVEVMSDGSVVYKGRLPTQTRSSVWRDMKVIGNHVYIGAEASSHGLQIFDLTKLLSLSSPKTFSISTDLTARVTGFSNSHNIVANEETKMIYAVGTNQCSGGLYMINVTNPAAPTSPGCYGAGGYVHDAQCVIYKGPDTRYTGREICFNFNEDTLDIVDVTNKASPTRLSSKTYTGASYTHQGWIADAGMNYLLLDDELDEQYRAGPASDQRTTTYIVDIRSLTAPVFTGTYKSPAKAIDHNQYIINGKSYMANYGSGLRIVDVSSVTRTPNGSAFKEVGYFDCHPADDSAGGQATFYGAWSVYPYFKSGYILLNSIERGVFSLKYTGA